MNKHQIYGAVNLKEWIIKVHLNDANTVMDTRQEKISELFDGLNIKEAMVTADAMGTQTTIVKKTRWKWAVMY